MTKPNGKQKSQAQYGKRNEKNFFQANNELQEHDIKSRCGSVKFFFRTPRTCCLFLVPIIFLVNLNPQFVPNLSLENYISGKPVEFSIFFFQFSMCNYHSQCKTPPFKAQKLLGNKQLKKSGRRSKRNSIAKSGNLDLKKRQLGSFRAPIAKIINNFQCFRKEVVHP